MILNDIKKIAVMMAICDSTRGKIDIVSHMSRHMKYILYSKINYNNNSKINIDWLNKEIKELLGFEFFPIQITKAVLKFLKSEKVVTERNDINTGEICYHLIKEDDNYVVEFEKSIKNSTAAQEDMIKEALEYVNKNSILIKEYKKEDILQILQNIFEQNDVSIIFDNREVQNNKEEKNKKKIYLLISKFIKESLERGGTTKDSIISFVTGLYLSSIVEKCYENEEYNEKKYDNIFCFIDTQILIYSLGLKNNDIQESNIELIKMMQSLGIKTVCLDVVRDEIKRILKHYDDETVSYNYRLYNFALKSISEKEMYIQKIDNELLKIGVQIVSQTESFKNHYKKENKIYKVIDSRLSEIRYSQNNTTAKENDKISICYVLFSRGIRDEEIIEFDTLSDGKYYFLTNNTDIVRKINDGLNIKNIKTSSIQLDSTFALLLWTANLKLSKTYPISKLVTNCNMLLEPTDDFIKKLHEKEVYIRQNFDINSHDIDIFIHNQVNIESYYFDTILGVANDNNDEISNRITKYSKSLENKGYERGYQEGKKEAENIGYNSGFKNGIDKGAEERERKIKQNIVNNKVSKFTKIIDKFFQVLYLTIIIILAIIAVAHMAHIIIQILIERKSLCNNNISLLEVILQILLEVILPIFIVLYEIINIIFNVNWLFTIRGVLRKLKKIFCQIYEEYVIKSTESQIKEN